ncbi:MAG: MFS transporter [Planctomycetota bacterium]|nr:MFS transporter [Planctomycetota bacterium]
MSSQFSLLQKKRFGPFFLTQFLGAFNDNVFKNSLLILIAFRVAAEDSNTLVNLSAGLFILPFFLFSATAGQLADKYEKSQLIRWIKIAEILIMAGAVIALLCDSLEALVGLLFLMGIQSAFFGPVKYGILPQHLKEEELVGGNGLVEMGTFLAILIGTILGGVLIGMGDVGVRWVSIVLIVTASLGYLASRQIPMGPPSDPGLEINWNPLSETWKIFQFTRRNRTVFLSILGISWFWFYGALLLAQLPNYAKVTLGGNEQVVTLLLALFSVGVGIGSMLCERLCASKVEIGLVPFGSIGMTLFGMDLYFSQPELVGSSLLGALEFALSAGSWRVAVDLVGFGIFGGFYIVPLYALIQQRSKRSHLSRVVAGNNVLNALFMVAASLLAIGLLGQGLSIPGLFLLAAIFNAIVAVYIYTLVPEFLMRFLIWILIHSIYRVRAEGLQNIPDEGPAVLISNHVSFVDALIIGGSVRRPVRFVMDHQIFKIPVLSFIFRTARTIPIASAREDPVLLTRAFDEIAKALEDGDLVCIFPEGRLTPDGELSVFRTGIEQIIRRTPVPVVPMALQGLWDSVLSRKGGRALSRFPRRLWFPVNLLAIEPVEPEVVRSRELQVLVQGLRGDLL